MPTTNSFKNYMRSLRKKKTGGFNADKYSLGNCFYDNPPRDENGRSLYLTFVSKLKEKHGLTKVNIKILARKRVIYMLIFSNLYYGCINPKINSKEIKYYL